MPRSVPADMPIQPSLLDRLLDDRPEDKEEPVWAAAQVVRRVRDSLCRDLQNLLNTRRSLDVLPEECTELGSSLLNYGLPDLQSLEIREDHELVRLCRLIEEAIQNFEPRLQGVRVRPLVGEDGRRPFDRRLRFEIEAVLVVEPLREPVVFASALDLSSGAFDVERSS